MIGRGIWSRFKLWLAGEAAPREVTRSVEVLSIIRTRIGREFVGPPLVVAWNRPCVCGTMMRNTSTAERCQRCVDDATRRAEQEAKIEELRRLRVLRFEQIRQRPGHLSKQKSTVTR